jgi:Golgi SNAP receptor complex protein 1
MFTTSGMEPIPPLRYMQNTMAPSTPLSGMNSTRWEELRKRAKHIEFELDAQLESFSRVNLSASSSITPLSFAERQQLTNAMSLEIQGKLSTLDELIATMNKMMDSASLSRSSPTTLSMVSVWKQQLQRHKDLLNDYSREYQRIKTSILQSNNGLLHNMSIGDADHGESASDLLLEEKSRLSASHKRTDQVIEMAFAARESLHTQRVSLIDASKKTNWMEGGLERARALISKIQLRKRRDKYILAIAVLLCMITLFLYWAHRS